MILVTGGSGFIGSHLVEELVKRGENVRIFDLVEPNLPPIEESTEFVEGDVRNFSRVKKALTGVDTVFHTIANVPLSKAGEEFWEVNVEGTRNVLQASLEEGASKVVYLSSSAVYDVNQKMPIDESARTIPVSDYGRSKYEGEKLCHEYYKQGLSVTIIRPRTVLGPRRGGIYQILFDWIRRGKNVYIAGSGNNIFQLVSARDLAKACILASEKEESTGEIFNIGADRFATVREDLQALIDYARTESKIVSINAKIAETVLRVLDILKLSPLAEWHYATAYKPFYFDITKARRELKWNPQDGGIDVYKASYDWYLEHFETIEIGKTHRRAPPQKILTLLNLIP